MLKNELLKSLIGKTVMVSVKEDDVFYSDKKMSMFTEEDYEYYSTDEFEFYYNEEVLPRIYEVYLIKQ